MFQIFSALVVLHQLEKNQWISVKICGGAFVFKKESCTAINLMLVLTINK